MSVRKHKSGVQREPAEIVYRDELTRLREHDSGPVPPGWNLSPRSVERFIIGDAESGIERKFVADRDMVRRIIISLCTTRGCLLVGEPGTAKSWLSELISAAVSGDSTLTLQGGSISTVNQLLYSWNEAILQREGPSEAALIPTPLLRGMMEGRMVRFEEIARCPQTLQDALLSLLSDRVVTIPELPGDKGVILARNGFNVIATSNSVDEGVFKMSAALKRRMDFEEIHPIRFLDDEMQVVLSEVSRQNKRAGIEVELVPSLVEVLVTIFHELRNGQTMDGRSTDRLAGASLSTAEAVTVVHAACLSAWYYGEGGLSMNLLVQHMLGSTLKDHPEDRRRLRHYFDSVVKERSGAEWEQTWELRTLL